MRKSEPAWDRKIIRHVDETMYVEGEGFRPVFVVDGEDGFRANGNWPYEGKPGQTRPWFFGHTIEGARRLVREHNERLGVSEREAFMIVARSMAKARGR